MKEKFFSVDMKQPVNQWICIGMLSLMCFWVVLYYFVNTAFAIGDSLATDVSVLDRSSPK